jgi:hypothetical protein
MLRSLLMGAVYAMVLPNVPMPITTLRVELFKRYRLDWEMGMPPDRAMPPAGGTDGSDLSRFFATGEEVPGTVEAPRGPAGTSGPSRENRPSEPSEPNGPNGPNGQPAGGPQRRA